MCIVEGNTGTISETGTNSRTEIFCAKRFHRPYSGQPALPNRRYREGLPLLKWYVVSLNYNPSSWKQATTRAVVIHTNI